MVHYVLLCRPPVQVNPGRKGRGFLRMKLGFVGFRQYSLEWQPSALDSARFTSGWMSRIAHPWRLSPALLKREGLPKPTLNPPLLSKVGSLATLLAIRRALVFTEPLRYQRDESRSLRRLASSSSNFTAIASLALGAPRLPSRRRSHERSPLPPTRRRHQLWWGTTSAVALTAPCPY